MTRLCRIGSFGLRNYVQRRATPVHGVTGRRGECWANALTVYCQKNTLLEEGKFNALASAYMEDRANLEAVAREYMHNVGSVHVEL